MSSYIEHVYKVLDDLKEFFEYSGHEDYGASVLITSK